MLLFFTLKLDLHIHLLCSSLVSIYNIQLKTINFATIGSVQFV